MEEINLDIKKKKELIKLYNEIKDEPSFRSVNQFGDKSLYLEKNDGTININ